MKLDLLNLSQRSDFAYGAKQNETEHRTTVQKVPKVGVKDKYSINTKCQFKMKGGKLHREVLHLNSLFWKYQNIWELKQKLE